MQKLVVLDAISEVSATKLRALLPPGFELSHGLIGTEAHRIEIIADADFAIAGQCAVTEPMFAAAKRLKLLHKWGVGYDNLDLVAAKAHGIKVARTTGSNALPVAEFALGLMLSSMRHIAYGHHHLQSGKWVGGRLPRDNFLLSDKTVALVGFGAIAKRLAKLLSGFGCTLLYTKPTRASAEEEAAYNVRYASFEEALTTADVLSLHCPLTPETAGLLNRDSLQRMKPTAVLINVARGGVVVEDDLVWALQNNVIHAAASDVYAEEPLPASSTLIGVNNMVITPHLAAGSADTFAKTVLHMYRNMLLVAEGKPVPEVDSLVG